MRLNKLLFFILAIILISGCSRQISQEQALAVAKDFVNSNVRFYTNEDTGQNIVPEVTINVVETSKQAGEWHIKLHITSKRLEEVKKSGLVVVINAKTGQVMREKLQPFKIE